MFRTRHRPALAACWRRRAKESMGLIWHSNRCRCSGILRTTHIRRSDILGCFTARNANAIFLCGGGRREALLFPEVLPAAQKLAETLDGSRLLRCGKAHGDSR